jgi:hypothetical protein
MFSGIRWKIDTNINAYTKPNMIIYKYKCKKMFVTEEPLYGTWGMGKEKENDGGSLMSHNIRYEGRGYKDVH